MNATIAGLRLTLEDGTDLAAKINPRHVSLTLTEKRGGEADELHITLQNADGALAIPSKGQILRLAIGWISGEEVTPGLVDKGRFRVDEVSASGPPDIITLSARSADFTGAYHRRRNHTWQGTTLGAVLKAIAARHGITAQVHPDLAAKPIASAEQHGKSDMAFVRDLGSRFDAMATWKDRRLVFMPIGSATNARGQNIPALTITRREGWQWAYTHAQRDEHDGAQAQWHDAGTGKRRTVSTGGENPKRLKRTYASQAEAHQAAKAEAAKRKRGGKSFEYDLALADMRIMPNGRITLSGWASTITGLSWLVESVELTLAAQGLRQKVKLEAG